MQSLTDLPKVGGTLQLRALNLICRFFDTVYTRLQATELLCASQLGLKLVKIRHEGSSSFFRCRHLAIQLRILQLQELRNIR